jgi:hypothetical protein
MASRKYQYEIIIVEDNSPDGTLQVAENLQVLIFLLSPALLLLSCLVGNLRI